MAIEQQTELLAARKEVDVEAIERELTRLWKDAAEGSADPHAAPVVRACALNLIALAEDERQLDELSEMVGEVTIEHPARIFLLAAHRQAVPAKLDAWISARCSVPIPGGKQVCCEQITLIGDGKETAKLPSIVTSLLVPDVPGVLLWKSPVDEQDGVLRELAGVVNRVLIDSSDDPVPLDTLRAWGTFVDRAGVHVTFGDLAWTHLTPWRSMLAHAFNPLPMRPLLRAISAVQVSYSTTEGPRHSGLSQALLLTSWLAVRLRWESVERLKVQEDGTFTALFHSSNRPVPVTLCPVAPRQGFAGGIEGITLAMGASSSVHVKTTAHRDCAALTIRSEHGASEEVLTAMIDKPETVLVAQELEVLTRDRGYDAVLSRLRELLP